MVYSKETIFLMTLTLAKEGHKEFCQKLLIQVSEKLKEHEESLPEITELIADGLKSIAQDPNEARMFVAPKTGSGKRDQNIEALLVFTAIDEMLASDRTLKLTLSHSGPGAFSLHAEKIGLSPSHVKDRYYEGQAILRSKNVEWTRKFLSMTAKLDCVKPIQPPDD